MHTLLFELELRQSGQKFCHILHSFLTTLDKNNNRRIKFKIYYSIPIPYSWSSAILRLLKWEHSTHANVVETISKFKSVSFYFKIIACTVCGERPNEPHSLQQRHMRYAFLKHNTNMLHSRLSISEMYTPSISFRTFVAVMVKSMFEYVPLCVCHIHCVAHILLLIK